MFSWTAHRVRDIPAQTLLSAHTCASQNRHDSLSACVLRSDTARLAATRVRHYLICSYDTRNDNKTVYRASGSLVILTTSLLSCISECLCSRSQASPCNATCSPCVLTSSRVMTPPCPHITQNWETVSTVWTKWCTRSVWSRATHLSADRRQAGRLCSSNMFTQYR